LPDSSEYAAAGVDIDAADRAKELIKRLAQTTFRPGVLSEVGLFGALFQVSGYREPVLVSSVDGVGTKLKIAFALNRHHTVGIDLVNHCVNDILTLGAEPLFFLDYVAMGKLIPEQAESIVSGLAAACRAVGCALIGGETAEMPGLYAPGEYDLAGFIVGAVERDRIIDGKAIQAGDSIVGLPSSGLHTNGYSLVRRVFQIGHEAALRPFDRLRTTQAQDAARWDRFYPELGRTLGEELLEPHRCYLPALKPLLHLIKGMAHITGGGLIGNPPRTLPRGLAAHFRAGTWPVPSIFTLIQKAGKIPQGEMYRVFNMGVGMALYCAPEHLGQIQAALPEAKVVGEVVPQWGVERAIIG